MNEYLDKNKKIKVCGVCGITSDEIDHMVGVNNKFKKELCNKHYRQLCREGKITNPKRPSTRKIADKNEYIYHDDYAEVCLYNFDGDEVARAIIDLDDVVKCKKHRWRVEPTGYVATTHNRTTKYIHRLILNTPKDMVVDHINHNTLDNRKSNIRTCTHAQNHMNKKTDSRNKVGKTGVLWNKLMKKWHSHITINKNTINLGYYSNKEDAINARKEAEIKYFGEYRYKG